MQTLASRSIGGRPLLSRQAPVRPRGLSAVTRVAAPIGVDVAPAEPARDKNGFAVKPGEYRGWDSRWATSGRSWASDYAIYMS